MNYLDKVYFCFAKIKLFKDFFKKETLTQMFSGEFFKISENTFYTFFSSCRRTGETIL